MHGTVVISPILAIIMDYPPNVTPKGGPQLVPIVFRSNYPIFMPKDCSKYLNLRLDSNVYFFNDLTALFMIVS